MQRKPAKRSSLFLLELIIAILFFCLASAVCVRFFVRSHVMEQETTELNLAVDQAVSAAEILRSGQDIVACLEDHYPDIVSFEDEKYHTTYYTIYYDQEWNPCRKDGSIYRLSLAYKEENGFAAGDISVFANRQNDPIYTLEVEKYLQKEANR